MIRLIVNSDNQPATMTFFLDRVSIIIGSERSPSAEIKLPGNYLREQHLQIQRQKINEQSVYTLINLAQDPSATLNGSPFNRHRLMHQDLIHLADFTIKFETLPENVERSPPENVEQKRFARKPSLKDDYLREYDDDNDST